MAILLNQCIAIVLIALLSTPSFYAKQWFQLNGKEAKFQFYTHVRTGEPSMSMTAYEVSRSSEVSHSSITSSPLKVGQVFVFDDPFTAEPDSNSEEVARITGQIFGSDMRTLNMGVDATITFTKDIPKGSSVNILGRYRAEQETHEFGIAGGTGLCRNAIGFVTVRPVYVDPNIPYVISEYNVTFTI